MKAHSAPERTISRWALILLATFAAAGISSAAAAQGSNRSGTPTRAEARTPPNQAWRASYAEATCNKLVPIQLSFLVPAGYVTRSPGQGTQAGCLWGTPADLDKVTAEPGNLDFTGIHDGVFWARATGNVGYFDGQFLSGRNKTERAERETLERSGAKLIRYGRVSGAPQPAQEIVAEYAGKRVYMLYLAMGIDSNTLLINYHPPAAQPLPASDQRWQEFLAGMSATPAPASTSTQQAAPNPPAARTETAAAGFWNATRIREAFAAYRQKLSGQIKSVGLDVDKDSVRLFVQQPQHPENVDSYTYRDGKLVGPTPERWPFGEMLGPFDWGSVEVLAQGTIPTAVETALERLNLEGAVPTMVQILRSIDDKKPLLRVYVDGTRKSGSADFEINGKLISAEAH